MKPDEAGFLTLLVVLELLILPSLPFGKYGGGIAMVVISAIGLAAYLVLFGARLRRRDQTKTMVAIVVASMVVGAVIAATLPLVLRGDGR